MLRNPYLSIIILALLLVLSPIAYTADKLVMMAWHPYYEEDQDELTRSFREAYPNIEVEFEYIPWVGPADYLEKIVVRSAGGILPDLLAVPHQLVPQIISMELFRDLTPLIEKEPELADMDDFMPIYVEAITVDGRVMAFPYDSSAMWINYNNVAFEETGLIAPLELARNNEWCLENMLNLAKRLTQVDLEGKVKRWGIGAIPRLNEGYTAWLWANGGGVLDGKRVNLKRPNNIEIIERMKEMLDQNQLRWYHGDPLSETGMLVWWSGYVTSLLYHSNLPDGTYDQVPFPARKGIEPAVPLNVNMIGITAGVEDVDTAWKLLCHISRNGLKANLYQLHGGAPARKSHIPDFLRAREEAGIQGHHLFGTPLAEMRLNLMLPQEANAVIDNAFMAVWNGEKSPVEAMEEATRLANNAIKEAKGF